VCGIRKRSPRFGLRVIRFVLNGRRYKFCEIKKWDDVFSIDLVRVVFRSFYSIFYFISFCIYSICRVCVSLCSWI